MKIVNIILGFIAFIIPFRSYAYDFEVDGIYYNINIKDRTASVTYEKMYNHDKYIGEIVIPPSVTYANQELPVTSIGDYAFSYCTGLTSVTIPNSVTSIGDYAFSYCTGLTSVTIPNSVTSIGPAAFDSCTGLTSVTIGNSVTSIGNGAFSNCTGLTSVTIPNSVTSIGHGTFYSCTGLTSVTIPNSVTSIGGYAFYSCTGLTSVTIGNSVTSIGDYAFYSCTGLTSVTIGNSVTSIGDATFFDCTGLTSVTIGNSVTSIGRYAFKDCMGLTTLTIPNSVTLLYGTSFYGCTGLINLTFIDDENPLKILTPTYSVFKDCPVEEFYLGRNIKWDGIDDSPFYYNTDFKVISLGKYVSSAPIYPSKNENLEIINCYGETPPKINSFTNIQYANVIVNIPNGCLNNYKSDKIWGNFWNLQETLPAPIEIEGIELNIAEVELNLEETIQLTATISPDEDGYNGIIWSSTDEKIASVNSEGLVTANSAGECVIVAASELDPYVYAECNITVVEPIIIEKVVLNLTEVELNLNETVQLTASITPNLEGFNGLMWNSSNNNIAMVDEDGLVSAVGIGECTITVISEFDSTISAECKVTVIEDAGVESLLANPDSKISVYSTEGILIKKDCKVEDLNTLSKGLYIIKAGNQSYKIAI